MTPAHGHVTLRLEGPDGGGRLLRELPTALHLQHRRWTSVLRKVSDTKSSSDQFIVTGLSGRGQELLSTFSSLSLKCVAEKRQTIQILNF